jgi:hypothetical protein
MAAGMHNCNGGVAAAKPAVSPAHTPTDLGAGKRNGRQQME